jgi:tRNA modification GTPase
MVASMGDVTMESGRATIFALSSGRPPAAIAVVRISGPRARFALETLVGRVPEPRRAALGRVRAAAGGEVIDEALVLWLPGSGSETGEDMVELQLHGGRAIVAATFAALGRLEGFRPAEAGEFTRRAFEHGRLDLTAVEGLADLIAAETEAQRRQAFRQMKGLLGERAEGWRKRLIGALALIEAGIDFPDEGDVPADLVRPALAVVRELRGEMAAALAGAERGERLREGLVVAIAGPPNAGKSTLLNALARREAAIVSPFAGTTRDVIEVHFDLGGFPVTVLDTAGIRESDDPVEREGIRRAQERSRAADVVLWVTDGGSPADGPAGEHNPRDPQGPAFWRIRNKLDLIDSMPEWPDMSVSGHRSFGVSAVSGVGVPALTDALTAFAREFLENTEPALVTRDRQRSALAAAEAALARAEAAVQEELVAEEVRSAANALGRLLGRVDVEDVLDVIFRDFCVGK